MNDTKIRVFIKEDHVVVVNYIYGVDSPNHWNITAENDIRRLVVLPANLFDESAYEKLPAFVAGAYKARDHKGVAKRGDDRWFAEIRTPFISAGVGRLTVWKSALYFRNKRLAVRAAKEAAKEFGVKIGAKASFTPQWLEAKFEATRSIG